MICVYGASVKNEVLMLYREQTALVTVAGAIILAPGRVTYHSFKASYTNPARSLKYE